MLTSGPRSLLISPGLASLVAPKDEKEKEEMGVVVLEPQTGAGPFQFLEYQISFEVCLQKI